MGLYLTAGFALASAAHVAYYIRHYPVVSPWLAPQFWVNYDDGFLRRGLPGTILTLWPGGLSHTVVVVAAVALTAIAITAWCSLAWLTCRRAATKATQTTIAAVLICSPLAISLFIRDVGRYDAIGIAALAVLATGRLDGRPIALALLAAGATASQEFMLAYLLPSLAIATAAPREARLRTARIIAVTAPAAVVALASALVRPNQYIVDVAETRAAEAGFDVSPGRNAATVLANDAGAELHYLAELGWKQALVSLIGFAAFYLAGAVAASWSMPSGTSRRLYCIVVAYCAALACAMSFAGIDFRRWWSLALVGTVACAAALARIHQPTAAQRHPIHRTRWLLLAVVVLGIALADTPVTASWWIPDVLTPIYLRT